MTSSLKIFDIPQGSLYINLLYFGSRVLDKKKGRGTMPESKLMTMVEAVDRFVPDGSEIALGCGLETCIPFSAGHELMRQKKRRLALIGPISDMLFDQLVGAGCADRIRAAWVGNVITGSGYNFRRAVESGAIDVEDHTNLTITMGLRAGAAGVPFMPTLTALGSDLLSTNSQLKEMVCPFTGGPLVAVRAIRPDVAIISVQRAAASGGAHAWGNLGVSREACMASRQVIIVAEEIVPEDTICSDPNRILLPSFRVGAVVHEPWSAHPSPMPGFYNRDHQVFLDYQQASKTPPGFAEWFSRWVVGVASRTEYLDLLGNDRQRQLMITHSAPSVPVDYGY
ncbi:3-oxoadipate CoA-transferase subunit A (EC; Glutaconate CoA-transferase subunit A (EC [Olavius algarvensis associated proteobacterium Delta 3]|nr:3-oxoadipate CoA-transferase subunit A (EC; Glutaconate CoA-transferase subunit A (EC [Olavius algarvensis associated proteobacterium Delta 3]